MDVVILAHSPFKHDHWDIPSGLKHCLEERGVNVNAYSFDTDVDSRYEAFNNCKKDIASGKIKADVALLCHAGSLGAVDELWNPSTFSNALLVQECGDDPAQYNSHINLSSRSNLVFTPDLRCHHAYQNRGIKSIWLTHWADDLIFYPHHELPKHRSCSTTTGPRGGNASPEEIFNGAIGGSGLTDYLQKELGEDFLNTRVTAEENAMLFRESKIVFQFARVGEVTRRIFEAAACGALVITNAINAHTGMYDLFEEDVDMVYYRTKEECVEKIKYYLNNDKERERIAQQGNCNVINNHMVGNRVDDLLYQIKRMI